MTYNAYFEHQLLEPLGKIKSNSKLCTKHTLVKRMQVHAELIYLNSLIVIEFYDNCVVCRISNWYMFWYIFRRFTIPIKKHLFSKYLYTCMYILISSWNRRGAQSGIGFHFVSWMLGVRISAATDLSRKKVVTAPIPNARQQGWVSWILGDDRFIRLAY